jgi:predicted short-subunit dehydrogenase-like oxidoreductase (DUF2520 family)
MDMYAPPKALRVLRRASVQRNGTEICNNFAVASDPNSKSAKGFCYAPGMVRKPRIAIVGAGNLGSALAISLQRAGFVIDAVVGRAGSMASRNLSMRIGARALASLENSQADLIWFCLPDSKIARAAEQCAAKFRWKGRVALHSSGALTSEVLSPLRKRGASVASLHPLMTFVRNSRPSFEGVPFAIEGDRAAVRVARQIVSHLGGTSYGIRKEDKAAYHAWGTFASPLLTALLATTERVAQLAEVNSKEAVRRMIPILRQTLTNYESFGGAEGFSGPLIRGDVETVKRHLRVLRAEPEARRVYVGLAQAALKYLPAKNKSELGRVLTRAMRSGS